MEKFFTNLWRSATKIFDTLADDSDVIFFTFVKIILILIVAKLIIIITKSMTRAYIKRKKKKNPDSLVARKSETIAIVIQSILRYTVYFFAIAAILDQLKLGITAGSILATAGIGGIALGLGAQTLIKDVFSGFFLLFENQYAVGDFVQIRDMEGTIEAITLRTTQFRKWTGEVVTIPNGTIDKVVNYTRGNMFALVVVYITRSEDIPKALSTMELCCEEYAKDNPEVVEKPIIQGLLGLEETGFALRAIVKTQPMSQWKVERAVKLKIYNAFQEAGIEVPYPKRVVIESEK